MIAQILIALFGVTAVWLSQDPRVERRKYACLFGLAGQPAWFYAAWTAEQWGIFVLCFLYSFSWLRGFFQHWVDGRGIRWRPKSEPRNDEPAHWNEPSVQPTAEGVYQWLLEDGRIAYCGFIGGRWRHVYDSPADAAAMGAKFAPQRWVKCQGWRGLAGTNRPILEAA